MCVDVQCIIQAQLDAAVAALKAVFPVAPLVTARRGERFVVTFLLSFVLSSFLSFFLALASVLSFSLLFTCRRLAFPLSPLMRALPFEMYGRIFFPK